VRREAKQFFFEKKNQKTVSCFWPTHLGRFETAASRHLQKFFGSFVQKRTLALLPAAYGFPAQ
jgi:hypothetical protein